MTVTRDRRQARNYGRPLSDAALVAIGARICPHLACTDRLFPEVEAVWQAHLPADAFALLLLEAGSHVLRRAYPSAATAVDNGTVGRAIETREVFHVSGARAGAADPYAVLAVPLIAGERCIGAIELTRASPPFEEREAALAAALAEQVAPLLDYAVRHRALREQVQAVQRESAQADNEFVSIVAHELRTPMTSIKGYTDLVLQGAAGTVSDGQRHFLQVVKSNVDRLAALVDDLLDTTRISAGRLRLERRPLQVGAVVREVCDGMSETLRERDLSLDIEVTPDLPDVQADRQRVIQVLMNLLRNACQYTPEGGRITVSVQPANGSVRVAVADTGIGIAPEDQQKVFERFYRADHDVVHQQPGSGLGLSIARSLIELHGGHLEMNSELGVGSTFRFTLPAQGA